jgi:signal transduction histidine kinase
MRLWRSVELFLALGDAERRTLSRSRSDVDLLDVVEDVAASVAERYGDRKISIEPATASTTFPSDEVALVRILSNLVENGVKYSPRGSTVRVVVAIDEAGANVSVTDACGGMAADDLRRAFQWSYQGNGSKDTNTGLGVGLYVAQRLTERLEGELEARNDGDGCTFSLHLPAP